MNRRRNRVGRALVVALAVTVLPAVLPTTASADPISDQKALVAKVTDQLEALQTQSDQLAENYAQAMTEKQQLETQVAAAQQKVVAQRAAVEQLKSQLAEVAVQAFMGAGTSGASPMFNSTAGVTDSLSRDQLSRVALSTGAASTDQYDQAVKDLESEQAKLDAARSAAEAKTKQIASDKAATDAQAVTYTKARADAQAKLGDLIQQEEERRARESYLAMQRAAEQAAAQQRAAAEQAAAQQQAQAAAAAQQQAQAAAAAQQQAEAASRQQAEAAAAQAPAARGDAPATTAAAPPAAAPAASAAPSARAAAPAVQAVAVSTPAADPPSVPPTSSRAAGAIHAALSVLGVPYVGYKASPSQGFDCSGLTMWAWAQVGVSLPHYSKAQYEMLPHVPKDQAQPGDLLFFHSPISHVSMYLGNGQHVSAPHSGAVVYVSSVNWGTVVGVARPG
jgi:peptidoglycan DL-endopeptidase CwlO